jgi:cysteine synthase A
MLCSNANLKFILDAKDSSFVDGCLCVSDSETISVARNLAKIEGIFAGFSSGANVAAALQYLKDHPGSSVVVIICDSGLKYLSTDLFE